MRQLQVHTTETAAAQVVELARVHLAEASRTVEVEAPGGRWRRLVLLELPNARLGGFIADLARAEVDARCVLPPQDVHAVRTPGLAVTASVQTIAPRAPFALVLARRP